MTGDQCNVHSSNRGTHLGYKLFLYTFEWPYLELGYLELITLIRIAIIFSKFQITLIHQFTLCSLVVWVPQSCILCVVLCSSFLWGRIVLYVRLPFIGSDYLLGIFDLFLIEQLLCRYTFYCYHMYDIYIWWHIVTSGLWRKSLISLSTSYSTMFRVSYWNWCDSVVHLSWLKSGQVFPFFYFICLVTIYIVTLMEVINAI